MSAATLPPIMVYLASGDAAGALAFYRTAFAAEEVMRWVDPDHGENHGKIGHAEFRIGRQTFFIADDYAKMRAVGVASPSASGTTSLSLWLRVEALEATLQRALGAGATLLMPIQDHPDSGRRCRIADPGGHIWTLAQA